MNDYVLSERDRVLIWVDMRYRINRQENGCWNWTGPRNAAGTPFVTYDKKRYYVQRLMCHGERPILSCAKKDCINPEHMLRNRDESPKARNGPIMKMGSRENA